jgi:predicted NAD/FAD-binding protein
MTGRRIAVVGGGVSGITAGYVLAQADHVTLFEADDRLGGHADTHPIGVDTGFIVYNEQTYPLLTRLFAELGVATQPSQMSMSVRCAGCGLQYAGQRGLAGLAAGLPRGRGRYLHMLAEVPRFHRAARRVLDQGDPVGQVLGDFLRTGGFSRYFTAHFVLPLVAAVWSCPSGTALRYPARYLFAFLANHGMLSVSGTPPWRTVTGGSRRYVELAAKRLPDIRLSTPVRAVRRPAVRASWNYQLSGCDPGLVIDRMNYAHPAYTPASVAAQRRLPGLNTNVTAFAGAYHGWGFHEDGCRSGAAAARALGGHW